MRDTRASTTLPPFLPLPVNILAEPETDAPTLWTGNASRYDVLREQKLAYKQPAAEEEAAVVCHREEGKAYLERKFTLMKMPKYLDRGTDGFHKSCLCSDCIYRTDVYIHIRCAPRFYGFRGECDARRGLDISLTGLSPLSHFSQIVLPYTYTRRGVAHSWFEWRW